MSDWFIFIKERKHGEMVEIVAGIKKGLQNRVCNPL
ncbi:hypothetical protein EV194_101475 [Natronoflexus pectinivorans]|uniref:Uncharacterized protein n=1 Tax=Natronoflexus pectinivorans TaxID=682526 RepID=A0A4R2GNF7_9BACT|nr:hypothetical protein EV194_101475 [Natronoflexus pectinivorans]